MTALPEQPTLWDFLEAPLTALMSVDEIFEKLDAELLTALSEDRRVERKPAAYRGEQVGDYISMWANTVPSGGIIVIGITDDGKIDGMTQRGTDALNKLEKTEFTYCPEAKCVYKRVGVRNRRGDADFVLAIRVFYHPTRVVKTVAGNAFVRRADSKHELKPEEVRQLQADKREISFEEEPCTLEFPEDFDKTAIQRFAARVRETRSLSERDYTDVKVLSFLHLGDSRSGTFKPNIACALLFAKDIRHVLPGARVRFLRFDGDNEGSGDKWNAVRDEFIDGTVPQVIAGAEKMVESQVRTFSKLGKNERFYTQPEYPKTAWYEAIVNACVHRSYGNGLKNVPIFIKMFDNRITIDSPGPFPPFVTPETIYESHQPRNPKLMEAMMYLDFVKCATEGTRRMKASMSQMALPDPEFQQKEINHYLVRVTLRNNVHQRKAWIDRDATELIGAILAKSLTENEKRLINFVAEHGSMNVSEAQTLLASSWPAAKKILESLKRREILVREVRKYETGGRDTQARYRLANSIE